MISATLLYVLHFDKVLPQIFAQYGAWIYVITFLIIFCETGLVVTPFLPGDSLLFALGAFAAQGSLSFGWLALTLFVAAVAGDNTNYFIGRNLGMALLKRPKQRLFKQAHYDKAHAFYEKWGGKAIILARFVPVVRTFSPFVAGVARMSYRKFIAFDLCGGAFWIGLFLCMGYGMGNLPWIKDHFEVVVPVIIFLSVLPIAFEFVRAKLRARKNEAAK